MATSSGRLPDVGEHRPGFTPQIVFMDLDGTCVDSQLRIHPRIRAAVREAADRAAIVIATGRMFCATVPWAEQLGVTAPLICYQGALIREQGAAGATLLEDRLGANAARAVIDVARTNNWHRQAYVDDVLLCEQSRPEGDFYAALAGVEMVLVDDLGAAVSGGSTKITLVTDSLQTSNAAVEILRASLDGAARVLRSVPRLVEVTAATVNKGGAATALARHLGVDMRRSVAIGDAPNDADLLAAAAFSVCVKHGESDLGSHADASCGEPEAGGVADVLEALL